LIDDDGLVYLLSVCKEPTAILSSWLMLRIVLFNAGCVEIGIRGFFTLQSPWQFILSAVKGMIQISLIF